MAILASFGQFRLIMAQNPLVLDRFLLVLQKISKNRHFRHPGWHFLTPDWKFGQKSWSIAPILDPEVYGMEEIQYVFLTFLHPCICGDLARTENRPPNRAPSDLAKRGPNRARMTRSGGCFMIFLVFLAKNSWFHGPESVYLAKSVKNSDFFSKFSQNRLKRGFCQSFRHRGGSRTARNWVNLWYF